MAKQNKNNTKYTIQDVLSYAQSAYFLNQLQESSYRPYWVGGHFGVGKTFDSGEINSILRGYYKGIDTYPQLNIGPNNNEEGSSMPLQLFKHGEMKENTPKVKNYLDWFRRDFIKERNYPDGTSKPDSEGQVYLSDGAKKMYDGNYPYISINNIPKKTNSWLNITDPSNTNSQTTNKVKNINNNTKGAQFAIFNQRLAAQGNAEVENEWLEFKTAEVLSERPEFQSEGNSDTEAVTGFRFTYMPVEKGSRGVGVEQTLTYTNSDTIESEQTTGTSGSYETKTESKLEFNTSAKVPFKGAKVSAGFSGSYGKAFTESKKWDNTLKEKRVDLNTITRETKIQPNSFKKGTPLIENVTLPEDVKFKNPAEVLTPGSSYVARYKYKASNVKVPAAGYTNILGTPDTIEPSSMQYQAAGKDKGRTNWSEDSKYNKGRLNGQPASFWGKKFIDYNGPFSYNMETVTTVDIDGKDEQLEAFRVNKDNQSMSILNSVITKLKTNYDLEFDIQYVTPSGESLKEEASNTLINLIGYDNQDPISEAAIVDLDTIGEINMSDYYEGFKGTDFVDGTEEGDDMIETFGGNDYVSNFRNSFLDTGVDDDVVTLSVDYGNNVVKTESGDDTVELFSTGNHVELGKGSDIAFLSDSNTVDLGIDEDSDLIIALGDDLNLLSDENFVILNFDIGEDKIYGLSDKDLEFRYDPAYQLIRGYNPKSSEASSDSVIISLELNEELDVRQSVHRLFMILLSEASLGDRDLEYIANRNLSNSKLSNFIERHVLSDENADEVDSKFRSRLVSDPWVLSKNTNETQDDISLNVTSSFRSIVDDPTLQSLGQSISNEYLASGSSTIKNLVVNKLSSIGFSSSDSIDLTNRAWISATSLISRGFDDNEIANAFLTSLVGGIENDGVQKAFKGLLDTNRIDGLALLPSPSNDNITGSEFDDAIRAGEGDDFVHLGAGNDLIRLGTGSDMVTLGDGEDTVLITVDQLDSQTDTVTDWNIADSLALEKGISYSLFGDNDNTLLLTTNINDESRSLNLVLNGWNGNLNALTVITDL